jgi:hypothetical protein
MAESPTTRATLLLRLRDSRDNDAWAQFVAIYAPLIFAFARKKGLQDADAADVTQDVLMAVAGAMPRLDYKLFSWAGSDNAYHSAAIFNLIGANPMAGEVPVKHLHKSIQDFRTKAGDGYGIEVSKLLFKGDDLRAKWKDNPGQLTPEDFRLRKGIVDDKEFGANVDLVGPGKAYEAWKQTAEYQKWRKDTGEAKN